MNLYIGNLAYGITEDQLHQVFSQYGDVTSVKLIIDRDTGRSKGFGFVEMASSSDGDAAIKALNETDLQGRKIKVNQARAREERPARRPRY
jgi:RNA recognition motif-containing protein